MAVCTAGGIRFYNEFAEPVQRPVLTADWDMEAAEKGRLPALHAQGDQRAADGHHGYGQSPVEEGLPDAHPGAHR